MKIRILGCRGSYPVAYPDIVRYGGETTSIEVSLDNTLIVLDAGTGIRKLNTLTDQVRECHLFITHLHWDHILGFPQWSLLWTRPELTLNIYALERSYDNFYRALERSVSEPLYVQTIKDMRINFRYHELLPGDKVEIDPGFVVSAAYANHPYRALGYRVQHGDKALAFVPDTAPFDRYLFGDNVTFIDQTLTSEDRRKLVTMQDGLVNLVGDADWLIYDSALTPDEYEMLPHWGHSTMAQAVEMARAGSAKELIFFHHNPGRTDDEIDELLAAQQLAHPGMHLSAAYEGMLLNGKDDG